jgi:hypothetical protein
MVTFPFLLVFRAKVMGQMLSQKGPPPQIIKNKNSPENQEHFPTVQLPEELPVFVVPVFEKLKNEVVEKDEVLGNDEITIDQDDEKAQSAKRERNRKRKLKKRRHKECMKQLDSDGSTKVPHKLTKRNDIVKASPFVFDGVIEKDSSTNL